MAENEEGPEHGPLSSPIHRPETPAIEIHGGGHQPGDDDDVPDDVAAGPPRVLDPAMLRNGGPNVGDPERRRRGRVESVALGLRRRRRSRPLFNRVEPFGVGIDLSSIRREGKMA